MGEAKQLLKVSGFYPISAGYHTFFWENLAAGAGLRRWERGPALLARLFPVTALSSALFFVARKVTGM